MNDERAPLPAALSTPPSGRVLVLAPHADDEVIGCGGTACLHALQGDPVRVVVAFDGGDPAGRRRAEARSGGRRLGLSDYAFLGYPEGHEPAGAELARAAARLAEIVREWRPDLVYAPWIGEHHLDHHVLARATRLALAQASFQGEAWGYEVWTPLVATRVIDVSAVWERKLAALREHASQIEVNERVLEALGLAAQRSLYLPAPARRGEAFAPLGPVGQADLGLPPGDAGADGGRAAC